MRGKKLFLMVGACALGMTTPALTQAPNGPAVPAQPAKVVAPGSAAAGVGAGSIAAITTALAGLIAFTAALSGGKSSQTRPTSP
jgi:hypothetical protein